MAKGQLAGAVDGLRKLLGEPEVAALADGDLLGRFATLRDEGAFAELVRRHGGLVLAVCRHVLGQEQDAEDAFQATFLVLARRAGSIRKQESVAAWLHGVALRASLNARKMATRRQKHERQARAGAVESAASAAALRELQATLDQVVQGLPAPCRSAFVLCCLEGKGRAEAARELGCQEGTVASRLARARALLQVRLARRGIVLSAALAVSAVSGGTEAAPASLGAAAARAAVAFAAGQPAVPAAERVTALASGVLKAMSTIRIKALLITLLTLGFLAAGGGAWRLANAPAEGAAERPHTRDGVPRVVGPVVRPREEPKTRATARAVRIFKTAPVDGAYSFAFTPDGKRAACGTFRNIHLWDLTTGEELRRFETSGADKVLKQVYGLVFSRNGKRLLAANGDGTVRLFDGETLRELRRFPGHTGPVFSVAFSRDGTWAVSAGIDGAVRIWDVGTGRELGRLVGHEGPVWCAVISPDDRYVLTGGGKESVAKGFVIDPSPVFEDTDLRLWDVKTRKEVRRFKGHACTVTTAAFSPDGRRVISGGKDRTARLWDTASGKELKRFGGELKVLVPVVRVGFSPDGRRALVCDQYLARLLRADTLEELGHFEPSTASYRASGLAPDGRRMFIGHNNAAKLWEWHEVPVKAGRGGERGGALLAFAPCPPCGPASTLTGRGLVSACLDMKGARWWLPYWPAPVVGGRAMRLWVGVASPGLAPSSLWWASVWPS
jgi:RNA polymerase sigma factor (sigma-70 family)